MSEDYKWKLKQKVADLPSTPGVYLYKNESSKIIYVGKAKKLKARVSSYFNQSQKSTKTNALAELKTTE